MRNIDLVVHLLAMESAIYHRYAAKIFRGQALSIFSRGIIFATGSQNKAMKTWQILTKAPVPTAIESADMRACFTHTHAAWLGSGRQMLSMQRTCGHNHMKAELPNKDILIDHCMIHTEYNPVCNRINWIITTKLPNKFNSHTCRENPTTTYGNHEISTDGKIQIKQGNIRTENNSRSWYPIRRFRRNFYSRKFLHIRYLHFSSTGNFEKLPAVFGWVLAIIHIAVHAIGCAYDHGLKENVENHMHLRSYM
jgi:hypothetical protein